MGKKKQTTHNNFKNSQSSPTFNSRAIFNNLTTFHYFVEIVTATGVHNQHTYSEKLPARGIIRRNLGTETPGRILDVRLRSLQNFCEF